MALNDYLAPIKWTDEQILKQYTKVSKKFNLDVGKKKYFVSGGLWVVHFTTCATTGSQLFGSMEEPVRIMLGFSDFGYSFYGMIWPLDNEDLSDKVKTAVNPVTHLYRKLNSVVRTPTFVGGVGLVGKFGVDLFNYVANGESMDENSYNSLTYGIGLLSLASSMYIKDTDPKLLDKKPFWKKAADYVKDKLSSQHVPVPAQIPPNSKTSIEDYITNQND